MKLFLRSLAVLGAVALLTAAVVAEVLRSLAGPDYTAFKLDQLLIRVLSCFLIVTLLAYVFSSQDGRRETYARLMGACLVSMLAVRAGSISVFALAILIVGLIIASERFMAVLAALWYGDSSVLTDPSFAKVLSLLGVETASDAEVDKVHDEEAKEMLEDEDDGEDDSASGTGSGVSGGQKASRGTKRGAERSQIGNKRDSDGKVISFEQYRHLIPIIEKAAIDQLQNRDSESILRHAKIENRFFDAVLTNHRKKLVTFVEVKFFPSTTLRRIFRLNLERTIAQLRYSIGDIIAARDPRGEISYHLLFLVVFKTDEDKIRAKAVLDNLKENTKGKGLEKIRIISYSLKDLSITDIGKVV